MGNAESHYICLNILEAILLGAEEHLLKRRECWLADESADLKPEVMLTPVVNALSTMTVMTSSSTVQTTGYPLDPRLYELAEGGALAADCIPSEGHNSCANPNSDRLSSGLIPQQSVVFASLELILCLLSKYEPRALCNLHQAALSKTPILKSNPGFDNAIPDKQDSTSFSTACLLTVAFRCLMRIPDLCAPRVLLSGLTLSGTNREQNASANNTACRDNLLLLLLGLFLDTSRIVLLQHEEVNWTSNIKPSPSASNSMFASDWQGCSASHALNLCEGNAGESEISSTANHIHSGPLESGTVKNSRLRYKQIDALLAWTPPYSKLLAWLVRFAVSLGTHHYPALGRSMTSTSVASTEVVDRSSDAHPDSSSPEQLSVNDQAVPGNPDILTEPNPCLVASNKWYEVITSCLIQILNCDETPTAKLNQPVPQNLAPLIFVCRICAQSPAIVVQPSNLRTTLVARLNSAWTWFSTGDDLNMSNGASGSPPFHNLRTRMVCLSAIDLLISHPDSGVRGFFIQALAPLIFYWLRDVSLAKNHHGPSVARTDLTNCLQLAFDTLTSVVSSAESSGRQGLLLILIPFLCNLLCDTPPSRQAVAHWMEASDVLIGSDDFVHGLHLCSVQQLTLLASRFPVEFRSTFCALGDFKLRLEKALKHSASLSMSGSALSSHAVASKRAGDRTVIQLKTDFSNFSSS